MGADVSRIVKDLARHLYTITSSPREMGRLAVQLADERDDSPGALKPRHLRWLLDRSGAWGYGLIGEALLERLGLSFLFRTPQGSLTWQGKARDRLRTWLATQLPANLATA
jgi:hypothetical protein